MIDVDWFYSDPHFGHKRIIDLCYRPFNSVEEMTEELIGNYNSCVGWNETTIWVGDCFFGSQEWAASILKQLHGRKILVRGNHDRKSRQMAGLGFDFVCKELVFQWDGIPIRVCHYPWKRQGKGGEWESTGREGDHRHLGWHPKYTPVEVLIHGHTHSMTKRAGNAIHVGVDAWDFRPASVYDVWGLVLETGVGNG